MQHGSHDKKYERRIGDEHVGSPLRRLGCLKGFLSVSFATSVGEKDPLLIIQQQQQHPHGSQKACYACKAGGKFLGVRGGRGAEREQAC